MSRLNPLTLPLSTSHLNPLSILITVSPVIDGRSNIISREIITIGTILGAGRDMAWGVATVWSVIYAVRKRIDVKERNSKVRLIPFRKGINDGIAVRIRF
jgi:hypothetical protein